MLRALTAPHGEYQCGMPSVARGTVAVYKTQMFCACGVVLLMCLIPVHLQLSVQYHLICCEAQLQHVLHIIIKTFYK